MIYEEDSPPWVNVQEKLFPRISQGCLDEKIQKKLGMAQRVIRERDFLFFYQLLLLLFDTPISRIREGKWLPYHSELEEWYGGLGVSIPDGIFEQEPSGKIFSILFPNLIEKFSSYLEL